MKSLLSWAAAITAGIACVASDANAQYRIHTGYGPLAPRTNYHPGFTLRYDRGMQTYSRDQTRYDDAISYDGVRRYVPDPSPRETNTLLPYYDRIGKDRYIFYERWQRASSPKLPGADAGMNQVK